MSELLGKQLRKQTARAKEKLLEGLGKAKATQDDVFDQHAANVVKQSKACERLYRDLKAYGVALKAMVQAQKVLRDTIRELYEPEWPDREHICAITQSLDLQWDEFEKVVNEQMMSAVNTYLAQFADLKSKVAKRGRKLVDFDIARNNYKTVRAGSKKGDDDPKVVKAASDLQQAETMYKEINQELIDTLPATYDSRITFFVDTLQTLFNADSSNHIECAKYNKSLVTQLDSLGNAFDSLRVPRPDPHDQNSGNSSEVGSVFRGDSSPTLSPIPSPRRPSPPTRATSVNASEAPQQTSEQVEGLKLYPSLNVAQPVPAKRTVDMTDKEPEEKENEESGTRNVTGKNSLIAEVEKKNPVVSLNPFDEDEDESDEQGAPDRETKKSMENAVETVKSLSNSVDERKVLYKVRATHHYTAEDTDEMTFDAGEIIAVLESKEIDQLDDGWLLGVKQSDGFRGVFPANFTKQI
ncbi:hypothetical protein AB6A40_001489 [Gnathostoma spinigerum]|uniref:Uncharacterized protein n=1 Tax=Gnathostoma spinigerum TaxID=75299 RepID=A0ABD6E4A6_9BILA